MLGWIRWLLNMDWGFSVADAAEMLLCAANPWTDFRLEAWSIALLIFAFLYLIFPADIIPDFIPVFGWGDDVMAVRRAAAVICEEMRRYEEYKHEQARAVGLGNRRHLD